MAIKVGIAVGAGHAAKECNVRARHPGEQQHYRGQCGKQNALKYSKKQHADEGHGRSRKIQPAHASHVEQGRKIQQSIDRGRRHRGQYRFRKILQQAGRGTADKAPG